VIIAMD